MIQSPWSGSWQNRICRILVLVEPAKWSFYRIYFGLLISSDDIGGLESFFRFNFICIFGILIRDNFLKIPITFNFCWISMNVS